MKRLLLIFCLGGFCFVQAQTKADTIHFIKEAAQLYDLDFTESEADSMIGNVMSNLQLYKAMHKTLPTNDIPYPFAFNPIPYGVIKQRVTQTVSLPFRADIRLPKNKNELAYYSIPELAGLIRTKQITSVELTKFFIERLKKWGDTLECVISLT